MTNRLEQISSSKRPVNSHYLQTASTDEVLSRRLCELDFKVSTSPVNRHCNKLLAELELAGLSNLNPRFYFGDEWFSPEDTVAISIPFYLGHPRLKTIEKHFIGEAEGSSAQECMRILRHEAGHCFDHAYQLSHLRSWQKIFGNPLRSYDADRDDMEPDPTRFVQHLSSNYAQTHPSEDFAETFAVWLGDCNWQRTYANRPKVMKKLNFITDLVNKYGGENILRPRGPVMSHIRGLRRPLAKHYLARIRDLRGTKVHSQEVKLKSIIKNFYD